LITLIIFAETYKSYDAPHFLPLRSKNFPQHNVLNKAMFPGTAWEILKQSPYVILMLKIVNTYPKDNTLKVDENFIKLEVFSL
jgi:hypothetical protein